MPLLDLSLVTRTLLDVIEESVSSSSAWTSPNPPDVFPLPPDKLEGGNPTIGFYLFHVMEESQGKNTYIPGVSDAPIRYTPLGLNLYYLLTAHGDELNTVNGTFQEQLLMGLAMKALHDNPLITDETAVNSTLVMAPGLRGNDNRFRVSLLPVMREDAVTYWTAGSAALRLSAYYQVSVIQLEPDEPMTRAGRVLTYGIYVLPSDNPRVDATESLIDFTLPGETEARLLEARPAQVTYDQPFSILGSAFAGDEVILEFRRADWSEPVPADPAWNVSVSSSRIRATARQTASGVDMVPGIYAASVRVLRSRTTSAGTTRVIETTSNETPFAIIPRIDSISVPDGAGNFTVTGAIFEHPDILATAIQVFVGAGRLTAGDPANLQPNEFGVQDAATLNVRLPAGTPSGTVLSFRLIINGAETAPQWVSVP